MNTSLDMQTLEAAATWYVQLNDGTVCQARLDAWQAWLGASPRHAEAWARVEALQRQWQLMPQQAALSGLSAAQAERRQVMKMLALLISAGGGMWLLSEHVTYQAMFAQVSTEGRARRSVTLEDGSQLELNTNTALDIRFDAGQRLIQLYRGEIMVQTAKDSLQRPFIVQTAQGRVRALGTRFTVRQLDERTQVGVLQDAVEVSPQASPAQGVRLETGQQATFDRGQVHRVAALPAGAAAWVQGMLSVNAWRLDDFIAELGRYRPGVLRCEQSVRGLSISGAYRIDDTDTILENLSKTLPVKVRYMTRYWVSIEPAGNS